MNTQYTQRQILDADVQGTSARAANRLTQPVFLQRFENVLFAVLLLIAYGKFEFSWWLLAVLVLVPDASILAYTKGQLMGTRVYNAMHNFTGPILLTITGIGIGADGFIAVALIWALHIALDRAVGYGLKYPTNFRHTHLSWK